MTRHTYRPGDAIDHGAVYYPMDGVRQCDPLEPEDVCAALDAYNEPEEHGWCGDDPRGECAAVEPPPGWSDEWLDWHGAEHSPLPGDTMVQDYDDGGHCRLASAVTWAHVRRFRYRGDWLPRGKFIPPAELWDAGCPVRCEWTYSMVLANAPGFAPLGADDWSDVTHIRLRPRHPKAELPEGWWVIGGSLGCCGRVYFSEGDAKRHGPAAIEQAVKAWLREMGDE